ncbi:BQ5605_C015g07728 [Microbotryum silenes-dioicae]|uniref:ATP-dependent DNA helicase n=1 Tax=Microbotryum silenes-dioicae TaxID=796604 RepID=A0A2X0LWF2_9BASI|nr:BQ5605_C015g07728 [Microbotryum silenes-dioicae]
MQHRLHFELVNKMLQDVCTSSARFGGITVLLAGDPRQCLPVVPKASPAQILDACIMNAEFWGEVQILHLSMNIMRLLAAVDRMTETELAKSQEFADWLLKVGDGSANIDGGDTITLPDHLCLPVDSRHKAGLINHVYPLSADDLTLMSTKNNVAYFRDRVILAPKNADVDELNNMIIKLLPGDAQTFYSADSVDKEDGSLYPTESLNNLNIPGMCQSQDQMGMRRKRKGNRRKSTLQTPIKRGNADSTLLTTELDDGVRGWAVMI